MKQIVLSTLAAIAFAFATGARAEAETFSIDNTHSFANWELRHVVARTSGTFHDVKGKVVLDAGNIANSSVEATISIYSLNSSHLRRDVHVLTDEFLDARNFPEMKFVSTGVAPYSADKGTMRGQLTLHGVTKPVTLDYQILGIGADPWGGMRAGFKATTRINRADFGITKYAVNGGPVGNEVDITLLVEGIKLGADGQPFNAKKAAEEKAKVISYPLPAVAQPAPVAQPLATQPASTQPAMTQPVAAPPATPQPAPEKKENLEDQLKKKLKGLLN
jgi:polyisoprenoid-binding protein YceI